MKIKDKITQSLASITVELQEISPDFYVIGASAMILSGIEVGETADIDILTTEMNSCKLQHLLKTYMEISPETKEDDLFRSNFARFKLPLMDIEVMGDLQIKKNDIWQSVCVKEYKEIFIGNYQDTNYRRAKKNLISFWQRERFKEDFNTKSLSLMKL